MQPLVDNWALAQRYRSSSPSRLAPGRFEYSFIEFVLFVVVLLAVTFIGLKLARDYRQRRDERLTESSGGWRIRSQLDIEAGPPYNRFPGLALRMPHDVMEGHDEGFEVSYFSAHLPRRPCWAIPPEGGTCRTRLCNCRSIRRSDATSPPTLRPALSMAGDHARRRC